MILFPSATGTVNVSPLMFAPGRAVVIAEAWQVAQQIWVKSPSPARTSGVIGPRDGALVDRIKSANAITSSPSSSGSATGSNGEPNPTNRPLDVFSSGNSGVVIPISLR